MTGFLVKKAGVLSLLQDEGRFGYQQLGLTQGGPVDKMAFYWANRLCQNKLSSTAIEISIGGLSLLAQGKAKIALTGANMPLFINGEKKALWQSHAINVGDVIELGFAQQGLRAYLAVSGGFQIKTSFGSSATVCREGIGGLHGGKLETGDFLPIKMHLSLSSQNFRLSEKNQPVFKKDIVLRTIPSYQQRFFSSYQQRLFYSSEFIISEHYDRMGYRLTGRAIKADISGILSEGICHGAIQIPADGQPIVLLNDRQTIGGYPKIGSVLSLDTAKLAQLGQGGKVHFEPVSMEAAHNINHLTLSLFERTQLETC